MICQYDTKYKPPRAIRSTKYQQIISIGGVGSVRKLYKNTVVIVDVVPLRAGGKRIERANRIAAMATRPVRGRLQIEPCWHLRRPEHETTPRIALLVQLGTAETMLPTLLFARVGRLRDWQLVVVGREDLGDSRRPINAGPLQAWWCRVVRDGAAVDLPAAPASTRLASATQ
jgi:hypothetical protein